MKQVYNSWQSCFFDRNMFLSQKLVSVSEISFCHKNKFLSQKQDFAHFVVNSENKKKITHFGRNFQIKKTEIIETIYFVEPWGGIDLIAGSEKIQTLPPVYFLTFLSILLVNFQKLSSTAGICSIQFF